MLNGFSNEAQDHWELSVVLKGQQLSLEVQHTGALPGAQKAVWEQMCSCLWT